MYNSMFTQHLFSSNLDSSGPGWLARAGILWLCFIPPSSRQIISILVLAAWSMMNLNCYMNTAHLVSLWLEFFIVFSQASGL